MVSRRVALFVCVFVFVFVPVPLAVLVAVAVIVAVREAPRQKRRVWVQGLQPTHASCVLCVFLRVWVW